MPRSRTRSLILRSLLALVALLAAAGAALAVTFYVKFVSDLPDLRSLNDYEPMLTSLVLDRSGQTVGEFYEHRRRLENLDEIPGHVVQAFLAAEDDTFYEHEGIDYVSILRAVWANVRAGGQVRQGASTITQQMVKTLLLTPERNIERKIREMILARRIEQHFSKDEILFLYLNQIYFGSGAYGVGEAARTYYGKEIGEITIGEAAMLAGLPKAPGRNSPYLDPERAEERRQYVLGRMRDEAFIDEASYREASEHPPTLTRAPEYEDYAVAAYFTEEVRRTLFERLGGERVLQGGLVVETTMDLRLQRGAVEAVQTGLEALDHRQGYRGPIRHVGASELAAEVTRVAEENGLAAGEALPIDEPLVGVVLAVDEKANTARIGFAPGLEHTIEHDAVKWARPFKPTSYPWEIREIATAFKVGDVAPFRLTAIETEDDGDTEVVTFDAADAVLILDQKPAAQGALISFEVSTGDVLAMVGGYDFEKSEFNRAVQAARQPGSAFKPLIYAAALAKGYTPATILHDRPVVYDDPGSGRTWRPQNYGRKFLGALTMREALARSVNNATIHLMQDIGVDYVVRFARRIGIRSKLEPNLSLALGSYPVTLAELVQAYAVFPNGGQPVEPIFIRRVLDRNGDVLMENLALAPPAAEEEGALAPGDVAAAPETGGLASKASSLEAVPESDELADDAAAIVEEIPWGEDGGLIPSTQAYLASDLLRAVVIHPRGTGGKATRLGKPVGGKTGTTNAQGDAWFIGFSPDVATGVWVGFDEKQVLGKGETGGKAALPIWIDYMADALEEREERDFDVPAGIVFARVDPKTGLLAAQDAEGSYFQGFASGTEPTDRAATALSSSERRRLQRLDF
ncbi:MAG: PBP1A family penicillin-binding protein [Myxococcales bacterium]|nr:PBP1A family penicillin-binding protein [Myxococcales bacterium]